MTIKEKLQNVAALAMELEHYRQQCKKLFEKAKECMDDPVLFTVTDEFTAWWERSQKYLAEMAYIDGLMDVYEESSRCRMIIRLKYYEGLTWEQVARRMHYSDAYVRRLHDEAIRRIEESKRWEQMDMEA